MRETISTEVKGAVREREGYSEVVQRSQRFWLHPAVHRRRCVRSLLRYPGERVSHAERGRDGRVRPAERAEGLPGRERCASRLTYRLETSHLSPLLCGGVFIGVVSRPALRRK